MALEMALFGMFGAYMESKGDNETLSKEEFMKMLSKQMPHFKVEQEMKDEIFAQADLNNDGCIEFKEFAMLIAVFAMGQYEVLKTMCAEQQKNA